MVACRPDPHEQGLEPDAGTELPDHYLKVDPSTWKVVKVSVAEDAGGTAAVTLLRPEGWFTRSRAAVGRTIRIELPELHLSGDGTILEIGPCPSIPDQGSGRRVVTGAFQREAKNLYDLYVGSMTGTSSAICGRS